MKKNQRKLSLKKMSISNLAIVKGGGGTVWCTITTQGPAGTYTPRCGPTGDSQCCDTRMDTHCDRSS